MEQTRRYQPVQMTVATHEKLRYMAKISNKPKTKLLKEIVDSLFELTGCYDRIVMFDSEISILQGTVTFVIKGRNRTSLGLGSIPQSKIAEVKKAFEEGEK